MNILDAVTELVAGNSVRRPSWPEGAHLESPERRPGPSAWMYYDGSGGVQHWLARDNAAEEATAEDWELAT